MIEEISHLRKLVKLRIPQSHYALASELMREGNVLFSSYEENDILLEIEIPGKLEHKVRPFYEHEYRQTRIGFNILSSYLNDISYLRTAP